MLNFYYTLRSPYARKVRILLAEMGTPHLPTEISPGSMESGSLFGEDYEARIPSMRVPSIKDGDEILFESNLVIAYLLEKYPMQKQGEDQPPLAMEMVRSSHKWQDEMVLFTIETLLNSSINITFLKRFGVDIDEVPYLRREQARCRPALTGWKHERRPKDLFPACSQSPTSIWCVRYSGSTKGMSYRGGAATAWKQLSRAIRAGRQ